MPVRTAKSASLDMDQLRRNASVCMNPDSTIEQLKEVSCTFHRKGHCPSCVGCTQFDDTVRECATMYATNIIKRPMEFWSPEFSEVRARPKVSMYDMDNFGMHCDNCYASSKCPMYELNTTCGIDWGSEDNFDSAKGLDWLIKLQRERVARAKKFEELDGGVPDQNTSAEMDRLSELIAKKADMGMAKVRITAEGSMPVGERTPSGGSILAKIFGGGDKSALPAGEETKAIEAPIVDISHEEVPAEKVKVPRVIKKKEE